MFYTFLALLLSFIHINLLAAPIRDYQTSRMISTSGAGVASVLMIDSISLNPAGSGFFQDSYLYAQHNNGGLKAKSTNRPASDNSPYEPKGFMVAIADSDTKSPGSFSYQKYEENQIARQRFSLNIASLISSSTSFGINYHYTMDDYFNGSKDKFHRVDLGMLKLFSDKFSLGFSLKDIARKRNLHTTFTAGLQYVLTQNIMVLFDMGHNYQSSFSNTFFYKGAAQIKFFKDFSFRAGVFDNKNTKLKGSSIGVSWFGPRLAVELAAKSSKPRDNVPLILYSEEKISEFSVAFTVKI